MVAQAQCTTGALWKVGSGVVTWAQPPWGLGLKQEARAHAKHARRTPSVGVACPAGWACTPTPRGLGLSCPSPTCSGSEAVRSHIGSERPELGPYKCMLTLTSKTRFGVMRDCQEQNREGDLGGSPGFGWTWRPKTDNILLVRWGVTFGIRAEDGSS